MDSSSAKQSKMPVDQALHARPRQPLVRRLNPRSVTILIGLVGITLAGRMIIKLSDGSAVQHNSDGNATSHRPTDERGPMSLLPSDYGFLIPKPPAPRAKPESPPSVEPEQIASPEALRRLAQLRREITLALDSPILFEHDDVRTGTATRPSTASAKVTAHNGSFASAANVPRQSSGRLEPPTSPYEVDAGTIIPAALVTAINSDLPGNIIGQVTANTYDSVTGQFLLIPQGTRLLGQYDSEVLNGQNRVLVAWQRLILPNGNSITLDAMPGTDAAGIAGMPGRVDHHLGRLAAATLLSTFVSLGGNLAADTSNEQIDVVGTTVAQEASRLGQRIVDRELSLKPTIHIRAGTEFNVLVNKELVLAPYKSVRNRR